MSETKVMAAQAVASVHSAVGSSSEHLVVQLLYQIIVIIVATKAAVWVARRFMGQTAVTGEIMAGLILGPSLLGYFFPDFMSALFSAETSQIFVGIANIGLILLMFQIGLEFEFSNNLRNRKAAVSLISVVGIFLPFSLGYAFGPFVWETLSDPPSKPVCIPAVFRNSFVDHGDTNPRADIYGTGIISYTDSHNHDQFRRS